MNSFVQFDHQRRQALPARLQARHGCGRHRPAQRRRRRRDRRLERHLDQGLDPLHAVHAWAASRTTSPTSRPPARSTSTASTPAASASTTIGEGTWSKGWTNFMPFTLGGQPYYVAYKTTQRRREPRPHQRRRQRRLDAVVGLLGQGLDAPDAVRPGRDAVLRRLQGRHRRGGDRQDHRRRQQRRDHRGVVRQLGQGLVAPRADDPQRRRAPAALQVHDRRSPRSRRSRPAAWASRPLGSATWTKSWTTFSPFTLAGKGHYLAYKTGTGQVGVDKLNAGGSGIVPASGRAGGRSAGP